MRKLGERFWRVAGLVCFLARCIECQLCQTRGHYAYGTTQQQIIHLDPNDEFIGWDATLDVRVYASDYSIGSTSETLTDLRLGTWDGAVLSTAISPSYTDRDWGQSKCSSCTTALLESGAYNQHCQYGYALRNYEFITTESNRDLLIGRSSGVNCCGCKIDGGSTDYYLTVGATITYCSRCPANTEPNEAGDCVASAGYYATDIWGMSYALQCTGYVMDHDLPVIVPDPNQPTQSSRCYSSSPGVDSCYNPSVSRKFSSGHNACWGCVIDYKKNWQSSHGWERGYVKQYQLALYNLFDHGFQPGFTGSDCIDYLYANYGEYELASGLEKIKNTYVTFVWTQEGDFAYMNPYLGEIRQDLNGFCYFLLIPKPMWEWIYARDSNVLADVFKYDDCGDIFLGNAYNEFVTDDAKIWMATYESQGVGYVQCPANLTSDVGSTSVDDCRPSTCDPGQYWPGSGVLCVDCPVDTYKTTSSVLQSDCVSCPANFEAAAGSTSFDACLARAGYYDAGIQYSFELVCIDRSLIAVSEIVLLDILNQENLEVMRPQAFTSDLQSVKDEYSPEKCFQDSIAHAGSEQVVIYFHNRDDTSRKTRCYYAAISLAQFQNNLNGAPSVFRDADICTDGDATKTNTYFTTYQVTPTYAAIACPSGTISDAGASSVSDCVCAAGYYFLDPSCELCANGKYKSSIGNLDASSCIDCPANTHTYTTPQVQLVDCECLPGFYHPNTALSYECTECPLGKYAPSADTALHCTDCPVGGWTISAASDASSDCVANVGYTDTSNGDFVACPEDTYKNWVGQDPCLQCIFGASSPAGSADASACVCDKEGYLPTGNDNDCTCAPGYYSNLDPEECEMCAAGTYCSGNVESSCPSNSNSPAGSVALSACVCHSGYEQEADNTCTQCPAGTYSSAGDVDCTSCPVNTMSVAGSDAIDDCLCDPGYTMVDGTCQQCAHGKFKSLVGNEACQDCHVFSTSPPGSTAATDCTCSPGYTSDAALSCVGCEVGKYKETIGNDACTDCPELTFTTNTATNSLDDCHCIAGYQTDAESTGCELCPTATFKGSVGSEPCTQCRDGATSDGAVLTITDGACVCDKGYSGMHATHLPQPEVTECQESIPLEHCIAKAGYYREHNETIIRPRGFYNFDLAPYCTGKELTYGGDYDEYPYLSSSGREDVQKAFKKTKTSVNTLQACRDYLKSIFPLFISEVESSTTDVCMMWGYDESTRTCSWHRVFWRDFWVRYTIYDNEHPYGFETLTIHNYGDCDLLTNAVQDSTSASSLIFNSGIFEDPSLILYVQKQCPYGYTSDTGATSVDDCYIIPCNACATGTYKNATGFHDCASCFPHSDSPSGSDDISDCQCNAGYVHESATSCVACTGDEYAPVAGLTECLTCGEFKTTDGITCQCNAGYYADDDTGPCFPCESGKYKSSLGSAACTSCGTDFTVTPLAATSASQCRCQDGYSGSPGSCAICPAETYEDVTRDVCEACGVNATSEEGSFNKTHCQCNTGYERLGDIYSGNLQVNCQLCAFGKYHDGEHCISCPAGSFSFVTGSLDVNDCICDYGYIGTSPYNCVACEAGKYKNTRGPGVCVDCPAGLTSDLGSGNYTDCQCGAGTTMLNILNPPYAQCTDSTPQDYVLGDGQCDFLKYVIDPANGAPDWVAPKRFEEYCIDYKDSVDPSYSGYSQFCCYCGAGNMDSRCTGDSNWVDSRNWGCWAYETRPALCDNADAFKNSDGVGANQACCVCGGGTTIGGGDSGYREDAVCVACDAGKYKSYVSNGPCDDCPIYSTSESGAADVHACVCQNGYIKIAEGEECGYVCPAGFQPDPTDLFCQGCTPGKYKSVSGGFDCHDCPDNGAHDLYNSTDVDDCHCLWGYVKHANWGTGTKECVSCETGFYNNYDNEETCFRCSVMVGGECVNSTTRNNQACPGICQARAGYGAVGDNVALCPHNTYNDGTYGECQTCPTGSSHALVGSKTVADCICHAGYGFDAEQNYCLACAAGKYKTEVGNAECDNCFDHASSPVGASYISDCFCKAGYTGVESCTICPAATFKTAGGSAECTACSRPYTSTPPGSISQDACKCMPGYGYDGSNCVPCTGTTFKSTINDTACLSCEIERLISHPPEAGTRCECVAGYFFHDNECFLGCGRGFQLAGGVCEECDVGYYQPVRGSNTSHYCLACQYPTDRTLSQAATSIQSCVCPAGQFGLKNGAYSTVTSVESMPAVTLNEEQRTTARLIAGFSLSLPGAYDVLRMYMKRSDKRILILTCYSSTDCVTTLSLDPILSMLEAESCLSDTCEDRTGNLQVTGIVQWTISLDSYTTVYEDRRRDIQINDFYFGTESMRTHSSCSPCLRGLHCV